MFTLACTGGIGSGKSYCAEIFASLGVPVYVADAETKELYFRDFSLQNNLKELLGMDIVIDGVLQKAAIARKIFSTREMLDKVNALVHPAVLADFLKWKRIREEEGYDLVMIESAIYFEAPVFKGVADRSVVVVAPVEVRIDRIVRRDAVSKELVMERIDRQMSDDDRIAMADYVIYADGKRAVLPQIVNILDDIR